jgi:hypothetical protein
MSGVIEGSGRTPDFAERADSPADHVHIEADAPG